MNTQYDMIDMVTWLVFQTCSQFAYKKFKNIHLELPLGCPHLIEPTEHMYTNND